MTTFATYCLLTALGFAIYQLYCLKKEELAFKELERDSENNQRF